MSQIVGFFFLGILTFVIGLSTGWTMRGSVKGEEVHKLKSVFEEIERVKWKADEIIKRVTK